MGGLLARLFGRPDAPATVAAKADAIEARTAELRQRLAGVEARLREAEAEAALAEAAGEPGGERRRRERTVLREEETDLRGAIRALEEARQELEPEILEERARAALAEYERAFEAARGGLLDRARPALRRAVEAWAAVEASYEEAIAAAQRYGELRHRLAEVHGRNGLPVPPSSVDRRLIAGLRRWEAQATSRELPALLARAREEE